jgi:spoIIIJ-associated protein
MKDQIFEGRDVPAAAAAASQALGVAEAALRYVVLERGAPGVLGMRGTPARIAVLLDAPGAASSAPARPAAPDHAERQLEASLPDTPGAAVAGILGALVAAARVDVQIEVEDTRDALVVRLGGPECDFFLEEGGGVIEAVEHLLQRIVARYPDVKRLKLECEGYRQQREEALRATARELAAAVRADGQPRTTRPLNSYERRIIHMVVGEEAGLKTFSVGEGSDRRVTVALATDADGNRAASPGDDERG